MPHRFPSSERAADAGGSFEAGPPSLAWVGGGVTRPRPGTTLNARRMRHGLLDLDWLGQVYPTPEGHDPFGYELALENLKSVWPRFEAVGAKRAVVAGTLLDQDHLDRLQDALRLPTTVVLVRAPADVLEERVRLRNRGRLLDDFPARTHEVAADIEAAAFHDMEIMNHGRAPADIANEILRGVGW